MRKEKLGLRILLSKSRRLCGTREMVSKQKCRDDNSEHVRTGNEQSTSSSQVGDMEQHDQSEAILLCICNAHSPLWAGSAPVIGLTSSYCRKTSASNKTVSYPQGDE